MNQFEGQRGNQQINQLNIKLNLQRSVSPICKLIILNNIDSNEKVSKSIRAKDDTSILDVLLYLEQQHKNQCKITLYHNNNPINVSKNTYLLPFLQKLKVQQLSYKATQNNMYSSNIEEDNESPGLDKKLSGRDSSTWLINMKDKLQSDHQQQEIKDLHKTHYQQSGSIKNDLYKQQAYDKQEQQKIKKSLNYYNPSLNQSESTIKSILCKCQHSYNSQELKIILKNAIFQNQIATCQKCNQKIPRSMYSQIKTLEKQYHTNLLLLELKILKNSLIQNHDIQKCQYCNFFCIWNKYQKINRGFCPNCYQDIIIYKKNQ
ncbi:unnamed protein product [Paramecium primaurelia]|uniref:Uncharacterized protein n=1 Tax=Paramecium primaurelia TaxID=5886 RepID=A0A8S1JV08_PARPR|nr:unnamed protein product [Paramecium primaurelia]